MKMDSNGEASIDLIFCDNIMAFSTTIYTILLFFSQKPEARPLLNAKYRVVNEN